MSFWLIVMHLLCYVCVCRYNFFIRLFLSRPRFSICLLKICSFSYWNGLFSRCSGYFIIVCRLSIQRINRTAWKSGERTDEGTANNQKEGKRPSKRWPIKLNKLIRMKKNSRRRETDKKK